MATLIPERPSGQAPREVSDVFRILRKLPDEVTVWHSLREGYPHFLVLAHHKQAFLIHVAATTESLVQEALQLDLLNADALTPDTLAAGELALLESFQLPNDVVLKRLLIFPNSQQDTLDEVVLLRSQTTDAHFLGLHRSTSADFLATLDRLAAAPLPEPSLLRLRARFSPETVIPASSRPTLIKREKSMVELPAFLDLEQEGLSKLDLELPPETERASQDPSTRLITGPAGSGKSIVLLHRALLAARLHPGAKLLVLTHNRPVNGQLKERFQALAPEGAMLEWKTFFQWANPHLPRQSSILAEHKVLARIRSLHYATPELSSMSAEFLRDELNYLRDLGIENLDDYLALDRAGRLTSLQAPSRERVWRFLLAYRSGLQADGVSDWHEQALLFHRLCPETSFQSRQKYDFIFIDEAQFFAAIWFTPVLAALAPSGQLFLSADPTQGFLKRRQSWRGLGLQIIGRSHRLQRIYRSTREIATFARALYLSRVEADEDSEDLPDLPGLDELSLLKSGERPHILPITSLNHAHERAADLVLAQLTNSPHLRGHTLILHADGLGAHTLTKQLRTRLGSQNVRNLQAPYGEQQPSDPMCDVASLYAATGLEAPVVILIGLDLLLQKEADPRLTPEARRELISTQTRLLYMACTRAISRLIILTEAPATFTELGEKTRE